MTALAWLFLVGLSVASVYFVTVSLHGSARERSLAARDVDRRLPALGAAPTELGRLNDDLDDLTPAEAAIVARLRAEWATDEPPPDVIERVLRRVRDEAGASDD
jgi:hypothetical protein